MELYRKRCGKKDADGNIVLAPPFKYLNVALYLSTEPKFSERYDKRFHGTTSPNNGKAAEDQSGIICDSSKRLSSIDVDEDVPAPTSLGKSNDSHANSCGSLRSGRPVGIKKRKAEEQMHSDMKRSVDAMNKLVRHTEKANVLSKESTISLERAAGSLVDMKLLQTLVPQSEEYNSLLKDIMRERRERMSRFQTCENEESELAGAASTDPRVIDEDDEDCLC